MPKGSSNALQWLLTKLTDSNGNYITYAYKTNTAGTQTVPDYISYGSNGATASPLKIQFYYQANPYFKKQYISSYYFEDAQIIASITVASNAGNYLLRRYDLSYTPRDEINFMTSIQESGENGEKIPVVAFEYGTDNKTLATTTKSLTKSFSDYSNNTKSRYFAAGDITGDGIADLLEIVTDNQNYQYANAYDGQTFQITNSIFNIDVGSTWTFGDNMVQGSSLFGDFNGDGKKTVIIPSYNSALYNSPAYIKFLDINSGSGIIQPLKTSSKLTAYAVADLNNDGRDDIVSIEPTTTGSNVYPGNILYVKKKDNSYDLASSDSIYSDDISVPSLEGEPKDIYVSDFDANGLKDIMVICKNGYYILRNNGGVPAADGIVHLSFTNIGPFTDIAHGYTKYLDDIVRSGDFNGDGMSDFITRKGSTWNLFLGTGNLSFPFSKTSITNISERDDDVSNDNNRDDCIVIDFDHDGKSDIIVYDASYEYNDNIFSDPWGTFRGSSVAWYKSSGSSFIKINGGLTPNDESYYQKGYSSVGDFDGDGREDLLSYGSKLYSTVEKASNKGYLYGCFNNNYDANLLKKVTDSFGSTVEFKYQPLTYPKTSDGKNFYVRAYNAIYPAADVQAPIYAVSKTIVTGGGNSTETNYAYARGKMNLIGKGFLGFEEITADNTTQNKKVKTANENDYTYCLPTKQTVTVSTSNDKTVSKAENFFSNTKTGKIYNSVLNKTIETDSLNNLKKTTEYLNYDSQGNLTQGKVTQGDLTIDENIVFAQKGTWAWGLNKPVSVTNTRKTGSDIYIRKRSFDYDTKGNLIKDTLDTGNENQMIVSYTNFDIFGHAQKITKTANGVSRSKTLTFTSPSGRYLNTETDDQLNQTTTYNYDELRGLLMSRFDRIGTTSYDYDNFGRLKTTTYPDNSKTFNALQWAGTLSGKPASAKYYSYSKTFGQSPLRIWYDNSGREIRRDFYGLNNKKTIIDTEYNSKGQVYRVSDPYFENTGITYAAVHLYDIFGRDSTVVTSMGTTSYTYSGSTTVVNSPTDVTSTTINITGWTTEEITNGKKVNFTYYASGLVKTATPQDGQTLSMEYDLQGNRIKLTDPDAGVITSKYNGWGQLTREAQKVNPLTDSVVTAYYYLASGLPNYKVRNNETTNYGYDSYFRPNQISISGKHSQGLTYDSYDRVIQINDIVDGNRVFIHKKDYDLYGNVLHETYPSGYYITNKYDKYGYLTEITEKNGKSVWKAVESNAKGQMTKYSNANYTTSVGIDSRGFPTSTSCGSIINMGYSFNSKGNLDYRQDNLTGYKESFAYDPMNRLKNWYIYKNNVLQKSDSLTFNAATGNIASKTDIGNFAMNYGEAINKPHALTSISGIPAGFPPDNLTVTYTDFKKIKTLTEGVKTYSLSYGADEQRVKSVYAINGATQLTRYYLGDYEEEVSPSGNIRKIHYIGGNAININNAGKDSLLFIFTDYLGSPVALTDYSGVVLERYACDPWGARRNPSDWTQKDTRISWLLNRGYTGHEHLDEFGIINMNGRVYDPLTAQFFSPDPYLQAPNNWLNYNRYSYCMNNPLIYVDEDGEWFWLIPAAVGFAFNYVSYGLQHGDWGWNAIGSGAIGAGTALAMYFSGGITSAASVANGFAAAAGNSYGVTVALGFSARYVGGALLNTAISSLMPPMNMPISDKFSLSISPGLGFGSGGLVGGINISGTYRNGDNAWTLGAGFTPNSVSVGGGYGNKDWGLSYYYTRYGNEIGPDGQPNPQSVGGLSFYSGKFSMRFENDALARNGDRWRSNAVELGFWGGKAVLGTTLYNNYMKEGDPIEYGKYYHKNLWGNEYGKWKNGQTYNSPLYVGVRSGNNITRWGYSYRGFQHFFQNILTHKSGFFGNPFFGHANYFMGYDSFRSGTYGYSGYYNPYSLYGR